MSTAVLFNDLILYRARSGIAGYTSELLRHLSLILPGGDLQLLSRTPPGKLLRGASAWVGSGGNAKATQGARWKNMLRGAGHAALDGVFRATFRASTGKIYHEPDLIPLSIPLPTVVTAHDLSVLLFPDWHPGYRVRKFEVRLKEALKRISLFIAVSQSTRSDLERLLQVPPEKIRVIPEAPRHQFQASGERRENFILSVGTIEPRKNIAGLLRAYASLPTSFRRNHPLWLAGTWGWNSDEVREMLEREPWKSQVKYLGFVDDSRLVSLLSRARAMVYPSFYEGFGLPPLEAMACDTPVIASHAGALKETIGDAARIVDPRDEQSLAEAMREVVEDDALAESLREKGRKQLERFDWSETARRTFEAYRSLG